MLDGSIVPERARYLFVHEGLDKVEVEQAAAGEIVSIAGLEEIAIGETLADPEPPVALPVIKVEAPTVRMTFGVNTSPFTGERDVGAPRGGCASGWIMSCGTTSRCGSKTPKAPIRSSSPAVVSCIWRS